MNIGRRKSKIAIVQLAYADFESLEISLANFCKFFDDNTKFFILQNGRGTYDTERTLRVAKRYERLYPRNIAVIDDIKPQEPYLSIKELLHDDRLADFDYICKVDDDVFPLCKDWLSKMFTVYMDQKKSNQRMAYVSALINNNPFGFKQIIQRSKDLSNEYYKLIAREHIAGSSDRNGYYDGEHMVDAGGIDDDVCGTIWGIPYISRWLHQKTTLQPDFYINMVKNWPIAHVVDKRYSINVMLFEKGFWDVIGEDSDDYPYRDDEFMCEQYCKKHHKEVVVDLSNPFVHLFFYSQREENRDLIPAIRDVYTKRLNHPYPIALQGDKKLEIENRLRFIEHELHCMNDDYRVRIDNIDDKINSVQNNEEIMRGQQAAFSRRVAEKFDITYSKLDWLIGNSPTSLKHKLRRLTGRDSKA